MKRILEYYVKLMVKVVLVGNSRVIDFLFHSLLTKNSRSGIGVINFKGF